MGKRSSFGVPCCSTCELKVANVMVGEVLVAFIDLVVGEKCSLLLQAGIGSKATRKASQNDDFEIWMTSTCYFCQ